MNATELDFVDSTGARWRVCDTALLHDRRLVLPIGSGRAELRVFLSQFGQVRGYVFGERESRAYRLSRLERQLGRASLLDSTTLDPALDVVFRTAMRA